MEHEKESISYYVDGVLQETSDRTLTPDQIIERSGKDLNGRYLLLDQSEGQDEISYEGHGQMQIQLVEGMHFNTAVKVHEVKLVIVTPVGKWHDATFPSATTIGTVIEAAIEHFEGKLNPADPFELVQQGSETVLSPDQTLEALRIKSGDVLVLVKSMVGGGK